MYYSYKYQVTIVSSCNSLMLEQQEVHPFLGKRCLCIPPDPLKRLPFSAVVIGDMFILQIGGHANFVTTYALINVLLVAPSTNSYNKISGISFEIGRRFEVCTHFEVDTHFQVSTKIKIFEVCTSLEVCCAQFEVGTSSEVGTTFEVCRYQYVLVISEKLPVSVLT